MFTGLIEEVGSLKSITENEIIISSKNIREKVKIGDSVSINGLCLTVTIINSDSMVFHTSLTTKKCSRFYKGGIRTGEKINLERALCLGERLDGHIVLGHVDDKAKIISITKKYEDTFFEFCYPDELKNFIAPKGSVAVDGISLTINRVLSRSFEVTVIPHTFAATNLKNKKEGDFVHIEVDFFARYIFNIIKNGGIRWS